MSAPIIAFFNNKGGVEKTSLVYHLAWMYHRLGLRVVVADLDPQANLTAAFLSEERLEEVWEVEGEECNTVFRCIQPLRRGLGNIAEPALEIIEDGLNLLVGDLQLSTFEDELSSEWSGCLNRKERSFRIISAFWRLLERASENCSADVVLVDLGPNLGAINRAALISADYVVVPLSPDLFSLQGLKTLGPALRRWREEWEERLSKNKVSSLKLPRGRMQPIGYVVLQHGIRFDRPVKAFHRWIARIPTIYSEEVIQSTQSSTDQDGSECLALLKHYQSLTPMAQEARKPIFDLRPADGAIGAHSNAVRSVYGDFKVLAVAIATRINLPIPQLEQIALKL